MSNPYKNSNLSATISPVKRGEPRNELKFPPKVRAWDAFSVKQPLMNDRYLLIRRGQKLDEGHNGTNLVPRSHSVTGNVRSGKVRFQACSVPARPEIRAFLSLRMFVLSVVILGDFAE